MGTSQCRGKGYTVYKYWYSTRVPRYRRRRDAMVVYVYLCRHGDREDYDGDKGPAWQRTAASLVGVTGQRTKDPPVSALGHAQVSSLFLSPCL